MGPFQEISETRAFGPTFLQMMLRLVPQAAARTFPPPAGHNSWDVTAAGDWLFEFFIPKKGHEFAVKIAARATDDASLERLALAAISNALVDEARSTPTGLLRSRLMTLLSREPGFVNATKLYAGTEAWALDSVGDKIYQGDWKDLLEAPALRNVGTIQQLNHGGPTSRENREKLCAAARIVLLTAGGAMRAQDLANALVHLFELDNPETYFLRDDDQDAVEDSRVAAPGIELEERETADQIWTQLTSDERSALAFLHDADSVLRPLLPRTLDVITFKTAFKRKLANLIEEYEPRSGSLKLLIDRSLEMFEARDSTSNLTEEAK